MKIILNKVILMGRPTAMEENNKVSLAKEERRFEIELRVLLELSFHLGVPKGKKTAVLFPVGWLGMRQWDRGG